MANDPGDGEFLLTVELGDGPKFDLFRTSNTPANQFETEVNSFPYDPNTGVVDLSAGLPLQYENTGLINLKAIAEGAFGNRFIAVEGFPISVVPALEVNDLGQLDGQVVANLPGGGVVTLGGQQFNVPTGQQQIPVQGVGQGFQPGDNVNVTATNNANGATIEVNATANAQGNGAPVLSNLRVETLANGDVKVSGTVTDPDGDQLFVSASDTQVVFDPLAQSLGQTTIDGQGDFELVIPAGDVPADIDSLLIEADDDNGGVDREIVEFNVAPEPDPQDNDGIPDDVENGAPNNGDGNNDGVPDSQQSNVASLPNVVDGGYVTIESPAGTELQNVEATALPDGADASQLPEDLERPFGFFNFAVKVENPGDAATVALHLPPGQIMDQYLKFGPTPDNQTPRFFTFIFDGDTGAEFFPTQINLHLVDGGRGDLDGVANGVIVDPGAPAVTKDEAPPEPPPADPAPADPAPNGQNRIVRDVAPGNEAVVQVRDTATGQLVQTIQAYDNFFGGVNTALGDVNGDGVPDLVTGAKAGGGPHVKVFDGATGNVIHNFMAYDIAFSGGVDVVAGDVNGDGKADIITGAGPGGGPHVKVFDGQTGQEIKSFMAYDPGFIGGVNVTAGDINGDGNVDIITGAGPGGGAHVKAFDGNTFAELRSFMAYGDAFHGGVFVAAGDINGDGNADIITGAGSGGGPHVKIFDGKTQDVVANYFAFRADLNNGVIVDAVDMDGNGFDELVAILFGSDESKRFAFDAEQGQLREFIAN